MKWKPLLLSSALVVLVVLLLVLAFPQKHPRRGEICYVEMPIPKGVPQELINDLDYRGKQVVVANLQNGTAMKVLEVKEAEDGIWVHVQQIQGQQEYQIPLAWVVTQKEMEARKNR